VVQIRGVSEPDHRVVSPVSEKDSAPITWNEARRILDELTPIYESFVSEHRSVFPEMVDAAANDGR
jgi:hypothetical protein